MLRSCPRFLRGIFRECFSLGLRERCRVNQEGDVTAEIRGWKWFVLVPMMIHKPRSRKVKFPEQGMCSRGLLWLQRTTTFDLLQGRRTQEQIREIPQGVFGLFTRTSSGVEPEDFHQVFAGGSLWKFTRSRGLHQRDVEGVPG